MTPAVTFPEIARWHRAEAALARGRADAWREAPHRAQAAAQQRDKAAFHDACATALEAIR